VPPEAACRDQEDHTNNVEQVHVDKPLEGLWQVAVSGATVPECEQTYSLIASPSPLEPIMPEEPVAPTAEPSDGSAELE